MHAVKRRRFFQNYDEDRLYGSVKDPKDVEENAVSIGDAKDVCKGTDLQTNKPDGSPHAVEHDSSTRYSESPPVIITQPASASTDMDFSERVTAVIGDALSPKIISQLGDVSANDPERAINMYFDGSWRGVVNTESMMHPLAPIPDESCTGSSPPHSSRPSEKGTAWEKKLVGTMMVTAWATMSGNALVKGGDPIGIERQQHSGPLLANGGKRIARSASKHTDTIVRVVTQAGTGIARLPHTHAGVISTLIDLRIGHFSGHCVLAPAAVRTGDSIYLELQCYIKRSAFNRIDSIGGERPSTWEVKETGDEKTLRLRRVAILKLFEYTDLLPENSGDANAKEQRAKLLEAAEGSSEPSPTQTPDSAPRSSSPIPDSGEGEEVEDEGKEVEQDQLDALYKKAQTFDFDMEMKEPSATFAMQLRDYQKQALNWMMGKESDSEEARKSETMHPLWEKYLWPTIAEGAQRKMILHNEGDEAFYFNPYSGELSLEFPRQRQSCKGGILADEMGLGKTIQILSLLHTCREEGKHRERVSIAETFPKADRPNVVPYAAATTLVVAPMSLLAQWEAEAAKASQPGTIKSLVYYGSEKHTDLPTLCCGANVATAPDLIITSYGNVLSEWNAVQKDGRARCFTGGLFAVEFNRIVLDEGHNIKNRTSKTARACYELQSVRRWVLTGTPIVNKLEDLYSLVKFLGVEPWGTFNFWRTFITIPFESKDFLRALEVVQSVLEPLVLRRTKDMKTKDGQPIVPLPTKEVILETVELSQAERELYDCVVLRAKRTFTANVEAGTVFKAYTSILAQILRLRQTCCHPSLVKHKAEDGEMSEETDIVDDVDVSQLVARFTEAEDERDVQSWGVNAYKQILEESEHECPICCNESMEDQFVTNCLHMACKKCMLDDIARQKNKREHPVCCICRGPISEGELYEVKRLAGPSGDEKLVLRRFNSQSSAKIEALMQKLGEARQQEPESKMVVFSQFTSFLDIVQKYMKRDRMHFYRFDGTLSQKERTRVLDEFSRFQGSCVLLISLKAGGVGLNLVSANRVFLLDPWWSFAVEGQAIDRIHRMGQVKPVSVHRFIVKDSVEERMLKIQDRKKFIASSLGMSEAEKRAQRIEDIKLLFD